MCCCIKAFDSLSSVGKNVTAEIHKRGFLDGAVKVVFQTSTSLELDSIHFTDLILRKLSLNIQKRKL